jgi:hypothetical protein
MNYDDYYEEYSEIDRLICELKDGALKGLKQDIKDKLDRLEKENNELQDIKNNWNRLEKEYKEKVRELENYKDNVKREAYRLPLEEMMKNFQEEYFVVNQKYEKVDKCNKCNDDRKLILTDAYGRETKINCVCDKSEYTGYKVESRYIVGISSIAKRDSKPKLWVYFSYQKGDRNDDGYYRCSTYLDDEKIVDFEKAIKNNQTNDYLFKDKKEAQKYANYLNENKVGE